MEDDLAYLPIILLEKIKICIELRKLYMIEAIDERANDYQAWGKYSLFNVHNLDHIKILEQYIKLYDDIIIQQNIRKDVLNKKYRLTLNKTCISTYEDYLLQYVPDFCNKFFKNKYHDEISDTIFRIVAGNLFMTDLYKNINVLVIVIEYLMDPSRKCNILNMIGVNVREICALHKTNKLCEKDYCNKCTAELARLNKEHCKISKLKETFYIS